MDKKMYIIDSYNKIIAILSVNNTYIPIEPTFVIYEGWKKHMKNKNYMYSYDLRLNYESDKCLLLNAFDTYKNINTINDEFKDAQQIKLKINFKYIILNHAEDCIIGFITDKNRIIPTKKTILNEIENYPEEIKNNILKLPFKKNILFDNTIDSIRYLNIMNYDQFFFKNILDLKYSKKY